MPTSLMNGANLTFTLDLLGSLFLPSVDKIKEVQIIRNKATENDWGLAQLLSRC